MSQPVVDLPLPETQATPPLSPPCTQVVVVSQEKEPVPVPSSPRQHDEPAAQQRAPSSPLRPETLLEPFEAVFEKQMRASSPSKKRSRSASPPPLVSPIKRARKADDTDVTAAGAAPTEPVDAIDTEKDAIATQV